jgi:hypothetical protein
MTEGPASVLLVWQQKNAIFLQTFLKQRGMTCIVNAITHNIIATDDAACSW